jgi:hypothetical protein
MVSLPPFQLRPDDRARIARALTPDGQPPPAFVMAEIERLLERARVDVALNMDARQSTTAEGRAEVEEIADAASRLARLISGASDEVQHFLDGWMPYGTAEDVALLAEKARRAAESHHRRSELERVSPDDGPPRKWVAFHLACELAPIWKEYSELGWSHRGPWKDFVSLAFALAGVDASAERMARNAARAFRDAET